MALCWNQDPDGANSSVGLTPNWVPCDQGIQWPDFWVCTDVDDASCSDGPWIHIGSDPGYETPAEIQAVLPGFVGTQNSALTAGVEVGGGGGSDSIWPQLTTADTAAIGAKVLMAFAVAFCIKLAYGVITGRR